MGSCDHCGAPCINLPNDVPMRRQGAALGGAAASHSLSGSRMLLIFASIVWHMTYSAGSPHHPLIVFFSTFCAEARSACVAYPKDSARIS